MFWVSIFSRRKPLERDQFTAALDRECPTPRNWRRPPLGNPLTLLLGSSQSPASEGWALPNSLLACARLSPVTTSMRKY
jgi:hypothetical protein